MLDREQIDNWWLDKVRHEDPPELEATELHEVRDVIDGPKKPTGIDDEYT